MAKVCANDVNVARVMRQDCFSSSEAAERLAVYRERCVKSARRQALRTERAKVSDEWARSTTEAMNAARVVERADVLAEVSAAWNRSNTNGEFMDWLCPQLRGESAPARIGFQPGDVVCCYGVTYGVVRYYEPAVNYYRVRVSTKSANEYVEMGVRRVDMEYANPGAEALAERPREEET